VRPYQCPNCARTPAIPIILEESGSMSIRAASCIDSALVPASHKGGCGFCKGFGKHRHRRGNLDVLPA
jgi:hypothetical protein